MTPDTPWTIEMDFGELTVLNAQRKVVARIGGQSLAWWERIKDAVNAQADHAAKVEQMREWLEGAKSRGIGCSTAAVCAKFTALWPSPETKETR